MNLPLLSTYILAVFLLIMTPGPVVALVTSVAARSGSRRAFATAMGTNMASLVLIAMAILMLRGVVSLSALSLALLGLTGALYISYLAVQGIRAPVESGVSSRSQHCGFWGGLITGLSNPKDMLFFIAFFPQFIAVTQSFSTSVLVLSLIWVVVDFAVLSVYILIIKHWVTARHQQAITLISSWILLIIACLGVAYNGWTIIRTFEP